MALDSPSGSDVPSPGCAVDSAEAFAAFACLAEGATDSQMLFLLAVVLDRMLDAIYVLDENGRILYANAAARVLSPAFPDGPRAKILGKEWGQWAGDQTVDRLLTMARANGRGECDILFPDGAGGLLAPRSCRIHRVEGPDHATLCLCAVCAVKSDSDDSWERRRRMQDQRLWEANKMKSLETLAGGVAHDFNNLLMVVLGNADLAMMGLPEDSPLRGYLQAIEAGARRASELSMKMLAYSGRASFRKQAVLLNTIVTDMASPLRSAISCNAELRFALAPGIPLIQADAHQIRQILMSLVINASEALQEGVGRIWINTGRMWCDHGYLQSPYLFDDLPEGHYAYLEVEDTGAGMDEGVIRRIFEPFFTTRFAGRGLGLAAVLGIVKAHGGTVKVHSRPGIGSVLRVLFPADQGVPAAPPTACAPSEAP